MTSLQTDQGTLFPLGVSKTEKGWNFAFFCPLATEGFLHLFNLEGAELAVLPARKTGKIAHIEVSGVEAPFAYAWKLDGSEELLIDPYSKGILSKKEWGILPYSPLSLHYELQFDWEGIEPPKFSDQDLVIYEVHTRGFTIDPSSGVTEKGTLQGFIQKLPYLKDLGINAIELLPISEFNENEYDKKAPGTENRLFNYWGYSTVHYFAPSNRLVAEAPFGLLELCKFVKEAHRLGIKVILDIVYNHTAEGGTGGPVYHFKGMDKHTFYLTEGDNFLNFSGCGNTTNANHPVVIDWIIKTLRDLVIEAQIDGFRFDLASTLKRGEGGAVLNPSPLIEAISEDPYLANTLLIAEPWDPGGIYEPGHFYTKNKRWMEWNALYRDAVRSFIKGTPGTKQHFATRIAGSEDLFKGTRTPLESLNFVTCHDGFSLKDLVSYNQKHNEVNGEDNRDGDNNSLSWNSGAEGMTDNPDILHLRERQIKNFFLALLVSQGTPMILSGDEYGHTKGGNNNTWCQDNRMNWFQWDTQEKEAGLFRFVKEMIAYRKEHSHFRKGHFLGENDITWHGKRPKDPRWDFGDGFLGFTIRNGDDPKEILVIFNARPEKTLMILPKPKSEGKWFLVANTFLPSPQDFIEKEKRVRVELPFLAVPGYSAMLLESQ